MPALPPRSIRAAEPRDAGALARLSGQLGYPSTDAEFAIRLSDLAKREDHLILAAEEQGEVVGWIHAFEALRVESGAFAEIGGLVVATSARGHGVGQALVRAVADWARRKGLASLRVRANTARTEAHGFYQHLGFEPLKTQAVFTLAMGPPPSFGSG